MVITFTCSSFMPRFYFITMLLLFCGISQIVSADNQSMAQEPEQQTEQYSELSSKQQEAGQNNQKIETTNSRSYSFLNKEKNRQEPVGSSMDALNVSLGLIFILVLIFSMAWLVRKMGYSHISGQGQLKLLSTMNLGQKEKIALIQVGQQQLLVGITSQQINTLHVLEEPLETTVSQDATADSSQQNQNFAGKLSDSINLLKGKS